MGLDIGTLENWLWEAACSIRGPLDAPKYKDYILPLLFYKRLSDMYEDELGKLSQELGDEVLARQLAQADRALIRFYIPNGYTWPQVRKSPVRLGERLTEALRAIAKENPRLAGVIDIVDFNATAAGQRILDDDNLVRLMEIINRQRLGLNDVEPDILGRAYEYLLRLVRDYVIFFRADDQVHKFVLRPHQIRAAERIVQRVQAWETSEVSKTSEVWHRTGLIWHTQGSGKTLTLMVAAHKLRRLPLLENPTLLIVVDRQELETQMVQNLEAFGFPAVVRAESRRHLQELLASDYRGLIVTLIHKFDRIPKNLNTRRNLVALIDEAHRSQEGDLAIYMRAALPNAFYFGFTGTPIDRGKIGRGTFETFGKPDPAGYQDKYGIDESIEDGTTVPLYYTLTPSELRLDRPTLENEFFRVVEEAGVASIEELNRILDKADKLKAVLKAPNRVDKIAAHVARHYRENVEPRFQPGSRKAAYPAGLAPQGRCPHPAERGSGGHHPGATGQERSDERGVCVVLGPQRTGRSQPRDGRPGGASHFGRAPRLAL
jgi:hypothetical protein